ncbi:MAG: peptide chain release factor N(5)-glutamine methyltransferase [Vicingaceae bacterium]
MKFKDNSIPSVFEYYLLQLTDLYPPNEIRSLVKMILESRLGYSSEYIAVHPATRLSESEMLLLIGDAKELKTGKPIQYILGECSFMDLVISVNNNVLIPRQETEELVNWILQSTDLHSPKVLDIGTGSGCIALALKSKLKKAEVSAMDKSTSALEVASENARRLKSKIQFIQGDIAQLSLLQFPDLFDIVVSNPPYVMRSESDQMHKNVIEHEPEEALFVPDTDALIFYKAITDFCNKYLKPGGHLYLEINEKKAVEISRLLERQHFIKIEIKKDLNGKDRMIKAVLAQHPV